MAYFPYMRGKQYELIALRDMCEFVVNNTLISPIIEPVRKNYSTLIKTLGILKNNHINFNVILNPQVSKGEIDEDNYSDCTASILPAVNGYMNWQPAYIINDKVTIASIDNAIEANSFQNITLIIKSPPNNEDEFLRLLQNRKIKHAILNDDSSVRRLSRKIRGYSDNLIFLADRFNLKTPNSAYINPEDEFFSDDHLFYKEEGYQGFSDYLTIGEPFTDGGFLPYSVAIHLTYFEQESKAMRIRHFLSDSNDDTNDTPGKVFEALTKLVTFVDSYEIKSKAIDKFREIHEKETYPGLGSLKKLSMLNHIELIYNFLSEAE